MNTPIPVDKLVNALPALLKPDRLYFVRRDDSGVNIVDTYLSTSAPEPSTLFDTSVATTTNGTVVTPASNTVQTMPATAAGSSASIPFDTKSSNHYAIAFTLQLPVAWPSSDHTNNHILRIGLNPNALATFGTPLTTQQEENSVDISFTYDHTVAPKAYKRSSSATVELSSTASAIGTSFSVAMPMVIHVTNDGGKMALSVDANGTEVLVLDDVAVDGVPFFSAGSIAIASHHAVGFTTQQTIIGGLSVYNDGTTVTAYRVTAGGLTSLV